MASGLLSGGSRLCFEPAGYMVDELPNLIKSSFLNVSRESTLERYLAILEALTGDGKTLAEIAAAISEIGRASCRERV